MVDENRSVESAGLYQSFANTPYFKPTLFLETRQAEAALMRGTIEGFAVLRGDFSRKVVDPLQPAEIGVFVNGVDANNARIVIGYALGTIANWAQARLADRGQSALPKVSIEHRYWFNPEIRSANFIVPGLIALVMTMIGALLTALVVAREWERGTMEAIMVSPASMTEIMLGKLVAYFVLGQGGLAISVGLGLFVFEVPFRGSFLMLIGVSAVFLVVSLAVGLVISTVARNQFVAAQLAFLITFMPALILSGLMFDIDSMPALGAGDHHGLPGALLRLEPADAVPRRHGLADPAAQPRHPAGLRRALPGRGDRPHATKPGVAAVWRRIRSLIVKEFLTLWKDRKSRFVLVVPPIVQLILFANAATFDVRRVSLGIWNEDRARPARELVARFEGSDAFHVAAAYDNPGDAERDLSAQRVKAVLHVGQTFSADVAAGRPARVQLLLDGRRSNTALIAQNYAATIVERFNREHAPPGARRRRARDRDLRLVQPQL